MYLIFYYENNILEIKDNKYAYIDYRNFNLNNYFSNKFFRKEGYLESLKNK